MIENKPYYFTYNRYCICCIFHFIEKEYREITSPDDYSSLSMSSLPRPLISHFATAWPLVIRQYVVVAFTSKNLLSALGAVFGNGKAEKKQRNSLLRDITQLVEP